MLAPTAASEILPENEAGDRGGTTLSEDAVDRSSGATAEEAEGANGDETPTGPVGPADGDTAEFEETPLQASPTVAENRDDDIFDDVPQSHEAEAQDAAEHPLIEAAEPPQDAESPPPAPVLGTYTIGGRTYRMFGDGSVEAVSEGGDVERFASMDELRKHLARA